MDLASDFDVRRVYQFLCYLFHLLSCSAYMEGFEDFLTVPTNFPSDFPLPDDLSPLGEQIILRGHMDPK